MDIEGTGHKLNSNVHFRHSSSTCVDEAFPISSSFDDSPSIAQRRSISPSTRLLFVSLDPDFDEHYATSPPLSRYELSRVEARITGGESISCGSNRSTMINRPCLHTGHIFGSRWVPQELSTSRARASEGWFTPCSSSFRQCSSLSRRQRFARRP